MVAPGYGYGIVAMAGHNHSHNDNTCWQMNNSNTVLEKSVKSDVSPLKKSQFMTTFEFDHKYISNK